MKRIITLPLLTLCFISTRAQYVTYNHDETKMNQIMVMETGAGTLKPAVYYRVAHNNYQKTAAARNKLLYRTEAGGFSYGQVDLAEKIDSALTSRAKIEALNMADRKVDIAWQTEGSKLESKMQSFQNNIDRIIPAGGSPSDRTRWQEYYNLYQTAIRATGEAYMPNAQRKKEYLRIYEDLCRQNETLIRFIVSVRGRAHTEMALNASLTRIDRTAEIATEARSRWKGTSSTEKEITE